MNDTISFCSFNCRSLKYSLPAIHNLCCSHDIVLLQEHWLIPNDLHLLNSVHPDFLSVGQSAVDLSHDLLIGRPYGGTAILYNKQLRDKLSFVTTDESRISGLIYDSNNGPMLILSVYMPTNYNDDDSYECYIDCLSKLNAIILDANAIHTIIAGDFNCGPGSKFFNEFIKFADENNLITSDLNRFNDLVTYVSDDGRNRSWIDHILCSNTIDKLLSNIAIHNDVIVSDHKPLSWSIMCSNNCTFAAGETSNKPHKFIPQWKTCDDFTINSYAVYLDKLLRSIEVPYDALYDISRDNCYLPSIDQYYADIINSINRAVADIIPSHRCTTNEYNVPGWNTFVQEKHDMARQAFLAWVDIGKPRQGMHHEAMCRTRSSFKLALRHCKNNLDQIKADACAQSLLSKDSTKFWKDVHKISNNKATTYVDFVNGASGEHSIAEMWKCHFQSLYSIGVNSKYCALFNDSLSSITRLSNSHTYLFSIANVSEALAQLKLGKAAGPDGLTIEAFLFGGPSIRLHLSILFNLFLLYGYVPLDFCKSTIIPLVKCKSGDLSDANNYRAIALSNSVSKILESLLLSYIYSDNVADEYQFGFKSKHSTASCTHVLKQVINYYRNRGSHVFTCFIDFQKAFDNVDYWLLFYKLINSDSSPKLHVAARLLAFWYSHQQTSVLWQDTLSAPFTIHNGVRQGSLLSPFLFRFYIRDLIDKITNLNCGCIYYGIKLNMLAYADDMVLLAPSWFGLQSMLNILNSCAVDIDLPFNTKKTVCMVFNPVNKRMIVCNSFPAFTLASCHLAFVEHFKYLGHIIDNRLNDDKDINREIKNLFLRSNLLCRRFRRCSLDVKLLLFRAFCICFYDTALWANFSTSTLSKFRSCYHKCLKYFFGYPKYSSVTTMLCELGLPSFNTLIHNYKCRFANTLSRCENLLVNCVITHRTVM